VGPVDVTVVGVFGNKWEGPEKTEQLSFVHHKHVRSHQVRPAFLSVL